MPDNEKTPDEIHAALVAEGVSLKLGTQAELEPLTDAEIGELIAAAKPEQAQEAKAKKEKPLVYDAKKDTEGRALIAVEKDGQLITVNPDTLAAHKRAGWKEV